MEDPSDSETLNMLHFMSDHSIDNVIGTAEEIDYAISQY
jgi:type IV pilus assembly protein PilB